MNWIILALAFVGIISLCFFAWLGWEMRQIDKEAQNKKAQEPVYTPEEEFYAHLLQQKSDLDADAFAARKAMLDEALRYKQ